MSTILYLALVASTGQQAYVDSGGYYYYSTPYYTSYSPGWSGYYWRPTRWFGWSPFGRRYYTYSYPAYTYPTYTYGTVYSDPCRGVTGGPADTAYSDTFEERSAARPDLGERIHIVQMLDGHRFEPAQVRINVGDSIEWRNNSREPHTVTADPEMAADPAHVAVPEGADPFDSGEIAPGDSFVLTFDQPGIYHYICLPHEEHGMTGTIVVRDSGAEQGAAPRPAADEGAAPAPAAEEPAAGELPPEPPQDDRY